MRFCHSENEKKRYVIHFTLIDEVEYDDISPWPGEPDGEGPTLELIDSSLDNALGGNWDASNDNGGTPGEINSIVDE